jgi:hypothetical protein
MFLRDRREALASRRAMVSGGGFVPCFVAMPAALLKVSQISAAPGSRVHSIVRA